MSDHGGEGGPRPAPAGWYPDADDPSAQQYWDGTAWTTHVRRDPMRPITPTSTVPPDPPAPAGSAAAAGSAAVPAVPARPVDAVPWGSVPTPTPVASAGAASPAGRPYAGAADRAGAYLTDFICVYLAWSLVSVIGGLVFFAYSFLAASVACPGGARVGESCGSGGGSTALAVGALILLIGFLLSWVWVWWRLVPGRMASRGGSIGMAFGGLEVEEAESPVGIGRLKALGRTLLPALVGAAIYAAVWFGLLAAVAAGPGNPTLVVNLAVVAVLGLTLLPRLWMLWDRRRQTLYDKAVGTVVVGPQGPTDPFSVAALVMAYVSWLFLPASLVLALPTVVLGHVGRRRRRDPTGGAGRGAASAALWTGYLAVIGWVLVGALYLWGSSVVPDLDSVDRDGRSVLSLPGSDGVDRSGADASGSARRERAICAYRLSFLKAQVVSYRNREGAGRYPTSQADLVGRYYDEPVEEYDFLSDGTSITYRAVPRPGRVTCPSP